MGKRIVYQNDTGGVCVITPADCGLTVEQIASKDVPAGVPYIIVDVDSVPTDRTFRDAWTANFDEPHGYGIGPEAWFAQQSQQ